jgi:hypothetical protein
MGIDILRSTMQSCDGRYTPRNLLLLVLRVGFDDQICTSMGMTEGTTPKILVIVHSHVKSGTERSHCHGRCPKCHHRSTMKAAIYFSALMWLLAKTNSVALVDVQLDAMTKASVTFELVDSNTATVVSSIAEGDVIGVNTTVISSLNIHATYAVGHEIKSARFGYSGNRSFRVANDVPFALCGNDGVHFQRCSTLGYGTHTMTVTPYSGYNAQGESGTSVTMTFSLVPATAKPTSTSRGLLTLPNDCSIPKVRKKLPQNLSRHRLLNSQ